MNIKHEWVLITEVKEKDTTDSGIYMGKAKNTVLLTGVVVKIGEKVEDLKEGQKVIYHHQLGLPYEDDGTEYRFIKEDSVMAVLED